jgi:hypothetical protein
MLSTATLQRESLSLTILAYLIILACSNAASAAVIPKLGFSIAQNADVAEISRVTTACGLTDAVVFLPPVRISLGDTAESAAAFEMQGKVLKSISEGPLIFARLRIGGGRVAQSGKAQEQIVTARVAEALKLLPLSDAAVRGLLVEIEDSQPADDLLSFVLADIAVKVKAGKAKLELALALPAGFLEANGNLGKRLASYYDALGITMSGRWQSNLAWIADQALNKPVFLKLATGQTENPEPDVISYLDAAMAAAGTSVTVLWTEDPPAKLIGRLCDVTNFLARMLPSDVTTVGPDQSPFSVTIAGAALADYRIFTLPRTRNSGIMVKLADTAGPGTVRLQGPAAGTFEILWYNTATGRPIKPEEIGKSVGGMSQTCVCEPGYAFILIRDVEPSQKQPYTEITVRANPDLTVEEIIARWQQYRESQRQILQNYIAGCLMGLHFQATGFGSGFDVSMRFQQFWNREGLTEWVQSDLYVNGVKLKGSWEFPLPQMEPQKVMTPPLELKLTEKYSYRLQGTDRVDGVHCYVIEVEPREQNEVLYSGRIWIDGDLFRQVRMELRQKGADSTSIANIETQNFSLVPDGAGNEINLIKSIYAQQTLNAAGRNFIVERTYDFTDYAINAGNFEMSLEAARLSKSPIFRDTEAGLQVLRKEGDRRVLVPIKTSVKSLVAGAMYDGSFDFPIPLFGLGLTDFNYRKTGAQLNLLFAGPYLTGVLSKQWRSRYRLALEVSLSALPGNNRVYVGDTESKSEKLWTFGQSVGFRGSWQLSSDLSLTGMLYLPIDYYRASADTDKAFVMPKSGVTFLPGFDLKYARNGFIVNIGASLGHRVPWSAFGLPTASAEPARPTFDTYYFESKKNFHYAKFMKTGFEINYYGGDRLDRFSRYKPTFIGYPRIKGIPSGTDSFDNVGIVSASHGINIFDLVRLEGYYNHAWGRNKAESIHYRSFDGLEVDFGTAGPWGTYLQGMVTFALKGNLDRYNSRWGVYLIVFKPLR